MNDLIDNVEAIANAAAATVESHAEDDSELAEHYRCRGNVHIRH